MEIHDFFQDEYGITSEYLVPYPHLSIYHSRRPMPELNERSSSCHLSVDTLDTRFMVLAPGGENPRPQLIPANELVGVRIRKNSALRKIINDYRKQFYKHETLRILGHRKPSSKSRNAFGARNFQPHIALLKRGSGIITDLTEVGNRFRDFVSAIHFDRLSIQKRKNF